MSLAGKSAINSETTLMSSRQRKGKVISATKQPKQVSSLDGMPRADTSNEALGTTSSMDTVRVQPRAPRRSIHGTDEVELTLLEEDEQLQAAVGVSGDDSARVDRPKLPMSARDKRSMVLLCILCKIPCFHRGNVANSC